MLKLHVTGPKNHQNLRIVCLLSESLFNNNNMIIFSTYVQGTYQQPPNIPPGNEFLRDGDHGTPSVAKSSFTGQSGLISLALFSSVSPPGTTIRYPWTPGRSGVSPAGRGSAKPDYDAAPATVINFSAWP
jgi:hypothetical protein